MDTGIEVMVRDRSDGETDAGLPPALGQAFEDFYREQYPGLVRVAFALTGRRAVAEEVVQDALVGVLRHWPRVSQLDKPGAYARRAVVNAATSGLRRRSAELRAYTRSGRIEDTVGPSLSAEVAELWAAVRRLPPRQAQAVVLYHGEDLTIAEVAHTLGCAEGTVKSTLHDARNTLRAVLGLPAGFDEEDGQ